MNKLVNILQFLIGVMVLVIINQLVDRFPIRIDLTEEKRYSISDASKEVLESLQEPVYVEVFLEGEMPAGFKRLQKAIRETLDQLEYYSDDQVVYTFKDPSAALSTKARNEYFRSLMQRGLQPTNLNYTRDGNKTEKLIFPGAIVSYYGKEIPVLLLKGNQGASAEEQLNQSIEGIEYELVSAIRNLSTDVKKNVGLILGHQEPDSLNLAGLTGALSEKYNVFKVDLPSRTADLSVYDAVILPKPTTLFSAQEKYLLDQYIMQGGKALLFLDALRVNMDSASGEGTYAFPYELGLDDMLFKYGVRINRNFVQDIFSGEFPIVAGMTGDQPQIRMLPWPFFPNINTFGDHPITKNLDVIQMKFVSTIDTVKADGVTKTPLLMTSQYSMVSSTPVKVAFNELQKNLKPERFTAGSQVTSYLLKGNFTSLYKNRILPDGVDKTKFKENGEEAVILVCADGDMIRNEFDLQSGEPLELGLSPYNQQKFANADFVLNTLDYMLNEEGVITSKAKEISIRPLDKVKVANEKLWWQLFNLVLPIVLLVTYGVVRVYLRKRKYAKFK
ncbi:gliding-associated putative ABC transporter substrate-binding component GldG [Reichenbachiella agariperforans]|uniref:Gliding-associated putative ABC transporter substrate-binding component GldG n=1 Tax=Reichenbachiella agariperforans TaxID=156994 RepID=A0A1M6LR33_REIAG|nr:gliding motility-associated ABC transporter substrate-binding protein GldG [Reichenbachiella agariperforans]SHJ73636.1 gliding-associated putative ABC transporter substrate-binding component GldG [Reichenbachiella agariperforans]